MRNDKPRSFAKPRSTGGKKPFDKKPTGKPRFDKKRNADSRGDKPRDAARERPARDQRDRTERDRSDRPARTASAPAARREYTPASTRDRAPAIQRDRAPQGRREASAHHPRLTGPLLWGFHAVRAAWLNPQRRVVRLIATEAGLAGFQDTLAEAAPKRPQPELIDKGAFERMMPPGSVHQGIAALVEALPTRDAHDLIAGLGAEDPAVILMLDQVTDPHNVGAVLRSAAAFGARGLILQDRHAPELTGVLAKTASGAVDILPVAVETNLSRAIELLQENGFVVVGLDERGDALHQVPAHKRVCLVLGAEGTGLRRLVADHCDQLASLPTQGAIKSLNVSNAAAVALYALSLKAGA